MKKRFKAIIEYDGTDFFGWQIQKNQRTVQGILEEKLSKRFNKHIAVTGAGRTDRGVHSKGQTAHFDVDWTEDEEILFRSLNSMLPDDVSVSSLETADNDFHARFSAISRSYQYQIGITASALESRYSWEILTRLNTGQMRTALEKILGEHNFKPFAKLKPEITNDNGYICNVTESNLKKTGNSITIEIKSNRFLHGMVRAITGTVVDVGRGAKQPDCIESILSGSNRTMVSTHAPAKGLFLVKVAY